MKRNFVAVLAVGLALSSSSCGSKSNDTSSAPATDTSTTKPAAAPESVPSTVAAVSKYDAGPRAGESPVVPAMAEQGEKLFKLKGCVVCHAFGKKITCPDMQGVSMQRTALWMENQILHPEVMVKEDPISHQLFTQYKLQMTNQGLKPDEAKAVIEYIKRMDRAAGVAKAR